MKMLRSLSAALGNPFVRLGLALLAVLVAAYVHPGSAIAAPFLMGVLTEGAHTGEFILSEANGSRSRDTVTVTVAASTTLAAGTVLARLTGTGKYVPYDNVGSDGSEVAYGILYSELVNDGLAPADFTGVVVNADAEVRSADLVWATGLVDADKTAGLADLAARGIKARS